MAALAADDGGRDPVPVTAEIAAQIGSVGFGSWDALLAARMDISQRTQMDAVGLMLMRCAAESAGDSAKLPGSILDASKSDPHLAQLYESSSADYSWLKDVLSIRNFLSKKRVRKLGNVLKAHDTHIDLDNCHIAHVLGLLYTQQLFDGHLSLFGAARAPPDAAPPADDEDVAPGARSSPQRAAARNSYVNTTRRDAEDETRRVAEDLEKRERHMLRNACEVRCALFWLSLFPASMISVAAFVPLTCLLWRVRSGTTSLDGSDFVCAAQLKSYVSVDRACVDATSPHGYAVPSAPSCPRESEDDELCTSVYAQYVIELSKVKGDSIVEQHCRGAVDRRPGVPWHASAPRPDLSTKEANNPLRFALLERFEPTTSLWSSACGPGCCSTLNDARSSRAADVRTKIGICVCKQCGLALYDCEHCPACVGGSLAVHFCPPDARYALVPLSTLHDGPIAPVGSRRALVPFDASEVGTRRAVGKSTTCTAADDDDRRWSMRELFENGMLLRGAIKANRLLRLTNLTMPSGSIGAFHTPESGATNLRIEGQPYSLVGTADHDNSALKFYSLGQDGSAERRAILERNNKWGMMMPAEKVDIVDYIARVLEETHPDVHSVAERLRAGDDSVSLSIVTDTTDTTTPLRTASSIVNTSHANVTNPREIEVQSTGYPKRIDSEHQMYERLTYPLLYQNGEVGWHGGDEKAAVAKSKYARARMNIPERLDVVPEYLRRYDVPWDGYGSDETLRLSVNASLTYETAWFELSPRGSERAFPSRHDVGSEHVLDCYCRVEESRMRMYRNNQSKFLRYASQPTNDTGGAGEPDRTVLPASHLGSKRFMRNKTADALSVVTQRGKPFFFITITTSNAWKEITSRLPVGASAYDYPEIVARVFHQKLEALHTRLFSGAIWGAPGFDPLTNEWRYRIDGCDGNGYLVSVIEFQQRGNPHAHIVVRFAKHPDGSKDAYDENERVPWIDGRVGVGISLPGARALMISSRRFICARKPTFKVLEEYGMIYPNPDSAPGPPDPRYDVHMDRTFSVHPQVSRSLLLTGRFANPVKPSDVLNFMKMQVLGRLNSSSPVYGGGPLEHGPHPDLRNPDPRSRVAHKKKCKLAKDGVSCKSRYPFQPTPFTYVGENGFVYYRREEGDEFIVPYNPWFLLEFEVHINIEFAASAAVITYLYKYLFKGARGDRVRYQYADGTQETIDETREYWTGKITSSAEAWWRSYSYPMYQCWPPVESIAIHLPGAPAPSDGSSAENQGTSEWDKYLRRPTSMDALFAAPPTVAEFYAKVRVETSAPACVRTAYNRKSGSLLDVITGPSVSWPIPMPGRVGGVHFAIINTTVYYFYARESNDVVIRLKKTRYVCIGSSRATLTTPAIRYGTESWYMKLIAETVAMPSGHPSPYEALRTVGDTLYGSYQAAAYARGLISAETEAEKALLEGVQSIESPESLISLFTQLTLSGQPTLRVLCGLGLTLGIANTTASRDDVGADAFTEAAEFDDDVDDGSDDGGFVDGSASSSSTSSDSADDERSDAEDDHVDEADGASRDNTCGATRTQDDSEWERNAATDKNLIDIRIGMQLLRTDGSPQTYEVMQRNLKALQQSFYANDRCPTEFGIPLPDDVGASAVEVEQSRWKGDERAKALLRDVHLQEEQIDVRDAVVRAMEDRDRESFEMFFLDGPAGTGKTTTLKVILAERRTGKNEVCLVAAPTNLAALLYDGGVSVHALVDLLVVRDNDEHVMSQLTPNKPKAQLIAAARLIVIDELPSLRRADFEALLQILDALNFNGVLLLSGDFRQIGGVVPQATHMQQVNASPRSSAAWKYVKMMKLTKSRRDAGDVEHAKAVTALGDGTTKIAGKSEVDGRDLVDMSFIRNKITDRASAVEFAFPYADDVDGGDSAPCAILAPHNQLVDEWNEYIQARRPGDSRRYIGKTEVEDSEHAQYGVLTQDVVEHYSDTSVAKHTLELKVGDIVMLTRSVDKKRGLVTNTRLRIAALHNHVVTVIKVDDGDTRPYNICRWRTIFRWERSDIMLARTQFPFRLAYAMTFNKAQGQTLSRVVIDFTSGGAFAHGHLYVAVSRVRNGDHLAAFVDDDTATLTTPHIVHQQLLKEGAALEAALHEQQAAIRDLSCSTRLGAASPLRGHYCGPVRRLVNGIMRLVTTRRTWEHEMEGARRHFNYAEFARKHTQITMGGNRNTLRAYMGGAHQCNHGHPGTPHRNLVDQARAAAERAKHAEQDTESKFTVSTREALRAMTARGFALFSGTLSYGKGGNEWISEHVCVAGYGVLGVANGTTTAGGPAPESAWPRVAIVDPAGLPFIKTAGPSGAGGASHAIYRHIGIDGDSAFPPDVRAAIVREGDACYHQYSLGVAGSLVHVVHVVGPDLRVGQPSYTSALARLASAYENVLREFANIRGRGCRGPDVPTTLRLLPVSGGIFAGAFGRDMALMARAAIVRAFESLSKPTRLVLSEPGLRVEMCVFSGDPDGAYQTAFAGPTTIPNVYKQSTEERDGSNQTVHTESRTHVRTFVGNARAAGIVHLLCGETGES